MFSAHVTDGLKMTAPQGNQALGRSQASTAIALPVSAWGSSPGCRQDCGGKDASLGAAAETRGQGGHGGRNE